MTKVFLFDYIWFRIAKVYYKWDSDGITASAFVGLSLSILLHDIIQLILKYTNLIDSFYQHWSLYYGKFGVGITLVIVGILYIRYRKLYWRCREKWKDEVKGFLYYTKGVLVIGLLILPWVVFIILIK